MNGATLFLVTAFVFLVAKGKLSDFTVLVHATTTSDTSATTGAGAVAAGASAATASTPAATTTQSQISEIAKIYGMTTEFQ